MVLFAYNYYSHYNLDICIYSLTAIEICLHEQENSKRQGWSNWPNRTDGVLSGPINASN